MRTLAVTAATAAFALTLAGCTNAEADELELSAEATTECSTLISDEYTPEQRPPNLDIRSTEHGDGMVTLTGISRGDTTSPAPYEFKCRHQDGGTELVSFERAEDETPPPTTSETSELTFDEFANSLTDEQFDEATRIITSRSAELSCQSAAGRDHVPEDQKPYRADMEDPIPYLGGYLVAGKIEGANGMIAVVGCEVDADNESEVTTFDVVE